MPKGKKKGKFEHKRTEQPYSSDEDAGIDMTNDNLSETSGQSDLKSNHDDAENDIQEKLEEKVLEIIDALSARSAAARATALVSLRNALQRRPLQGVLAHHRAALADHVAKALRRGKDAERKAAAALAPILALQIGDEAAEEYVAEVRPALTATIADRSASLDARTECCSSLAALCYLLEEDLSVLLDIMRLYETIFSGSYLKGDGSVKVSGSAVEEGAFHSAALDGWALLLTLLPPPHAAAVLSAQPPGVQRLTELLEASCIEVRMAAGSALAMAHEHITSDSAEFEEPDTLLPRLEELSRESHKYRAKRDRKMQRATFRDVLKYFESGDVTTLSVRLGRESVTCSDWCSRSAYAALAGALGAALGALAPSSGPLRGALGLGDPLPGAMPTSKLNKLQRHLQNSAADKARTVARNKNRDKRSAALAL